MKIGGTLGKIGNWAKDRITPPSNNKGGPAAPREQTPERMAEINADAARLDSAYGKQDQAYQQKYSIPGSDYMYADTVRDAFQPTLGQLGGLTGAVNVDPTFKNYQMQLAQQLQNQAMGQGPSLAQMQLQQATDRTLNQSLGAIKSGMGGQNAALAARTAALASSQQLAGMGQQSGMLRLQEQQQAQEALAGLSNQARTQDINTALQERQIQLGALAQQSDTIQQSLGGIQDINRGRMGMQADAANAAAAGKQADKAAAKQQQNQIIGAVVTAGAGALGSMALKGGSDKMPARTKQTYRK